MMQRKPAAREVSFSAIPATLTKITAALVASAALINSGMDVVNALTHTPVGKREKLNVELFEKNFGKKPIVEQPLEVATSNLKLPMMIQVFPSGDAYVRYGNFDQWLPFKSVKDALQESGSIFPNANAQSSLPQQTPPSTTPAQLPQAIYIDLDRLRAEEKTNNAAPPVADRIEKTYLIAEKKEDHPYLFERSVRDYARKFPAEPGYRFTSFDFLLGTSSHYSPGKIEIVEDGKAILATFRLRSGSAVNRYPGWVQGSLRTVQSRNR